MKQAPLVFQEHKNHKLLENTAPSLKGGPKYTFLGYQKPFSRVVWNVGWVRSEAYGRYFKSFELGGSLWLGLIVWTSLFPCYLGLTDSFVSLFCPSESMAEGGDMVASAFPGDGAITGAVWAEHGQKQNVKRHFLIEFFSLSHHPWTWISTRKTAEWGSQEENTPNHETWENDTCIATELFCTFYLWIAVFKY